MSAIKQTKTYWIITEKDDLYEQQYYKDQAGKPLANPTRREDIQHVQDRPNGHWYFRFPEQFIQSTNRKWIVVQHVLESHPDRDDGGNELDARVMTDDIILHSSFVKRDPYEDHAVMLCNQVRTKYKKYEYTSHDPNFEIWFTSFAVENPKDFKLYQKSTRFFIELMLIY